MHAGKNPFRHSPRLFINSPILADTDIHADSSLYNRADTLIVTTIAAAHTQHGRAEHKSTIYELLLPAQVGGVQHIRRYQQELPLSRLQLLTAADKLPPALQNMNQLKFTMPVHGHVYKPFWQPALVITVWHPCSAVLSLFQRLSVRCHNRSPFFSLFAIPNVPRSHPQLPVFFHFYMYDRIVSLQSSILIEFSISIIILYYYSPYFSIFLIRLAETERKCSFLQQYDTE